MGVTFLHPDKRLWEGNFLSRPGLVLVSSERLSSGHLGRCVIDHRPDQDDDTSILPPCRPQRCLVLWTPQWQGEVTRERKF